MTDPAIIEAAARALRDSHCEDNGSPVWGEYCDMARAVLAAVTPLIEAAALERAAKVADSRPDSLMKIEAREIAAAIRALIQPPASGI
jgi:hypothetical protein